MARPAVGPEQSPIQCVPRTPAEEVSGRHVKLTTARRKLPWHAEEERSCVPCVLLSFPYSLPASHIPSSYRGYLIAYQSVTYRIVTVDTL